MVRAGLGSQYRISIVRREISSSSTIDPLCSKISRVEKRLSNVLTASETRFVLVNGQSILRLKLVALSSACSPR